MSADYPSFIRPTTTPPEIIVLSLWLACKANSRKLNATIFHWAKPISRFMVNQFIRFPAKNHNSSYKVPLISFFPSQDYSNDHLPNHWKSSYVTGRNLRLSWVVVQRYCQTDITYRITTNGWWSCPAIVFGDSLKSNFSFVLLYWLMWVFICESIGFYIEAALLSWWNCDEICHFNFDESPSHFNYKISERIYHHKFNYKLIWLTKEYFLFFSHFPNWNSI